MSIKRIIFRATRLAMAILIFLSLSMKGSEIGTTEVVESFEEKPEVKYIDKNILMDFLYQQEDAGIELIEKIESNLEDLEADITPEDMEDIYTYEQPEKDPWDHL